MNLIDVAKKFATPEACNDFREAMRWPDGVTCQRPGCQSKNITRYTKKIGKRMRVNAAGEKVEKTVSSRILYFCVGCKFQFSRPLRLERCYMA